MQTYTRAYQAPFGALTLTCTAEGLTALYAGKTEKQDDHPILSQTVTQLNEYFTGTRTAFELPLSPVGTDFQKRVWTALCRVPYGKTVTYGELAKMAGAPRAARAVGGAVGANHLLILIPCHRVVAAHGIGGFSCGLPIKKALMQAEKIPF